MYNLQSDYQLLCHTIVNAHYCLEPLLHDESKKEEMRWLAQQTSTHIIQSNSVENGFELFIVGPVAGILTARKYIIVCFAKRLLKTLILPFEVIRTWYSLSELKLHGGLLGQLHI